MARDAMFIRDAETVVGAESGPSNAYVTRVTIELGGQRFQFEPALARKIARRLNQFAKVASAA